jgi:hypothetical protein
MRICRQPGRARNNGAIVIFSASVLLTAPAHGDSATDYSAVHRVAIISKLGPDIHLEKIGITRFDLKNSDMAIDWGIDDYVRSSVATMIGPRFTVIAPAIDPRIFDKPEILGHLSSEKFGKLNSVPIANRADAYIVVYPVEILAGEPAGVVLSHDKEFFTQHTSLSAMYWLYVIAGQTGAKLNYGTARIPASGHLGGYSIPVVGCDNDLWADSPDEFTNAQKTILKQEITVLLDKSLPFALKGAGLITDTDASDLYRTAAHQSTTCRPL